MNAQPLVNINRFEALVTETQDEDMNGPATFGVVRLLAAHIDSAFSQIQSSLIRLDDKIDGAEQKITARIDSLERRLDDKIDSKVDSLEQKITARIESLEQKITARIDSLERRLDDKIDSKVDSLEQKITARIDGLEQKITARIDGLEIMLRADMTANHGIIMDQFAQRVNSDRFIKVGFAVAVIGVLLQTAIQIR